MADESGRGAAGGSGAGAGAGTGGEAGPSRRLCAGGGYTNEEYSSDSDDAPLIDVGNSSPDDADEEDGLARDGSAAVRIRIPEEADGRRGCDPHERYPKERGKTLLAVAMLFVAGVSNVIVLSVVHEKVPEQPPLPDFIFSLTPYYPYGLNLTEYIMLSSFAAMALLILFHRHRWIVLRRLATIGSLLYFGRCVTMFVTQVPVADPNWHCSPKLQGENATFANVLLRALSVVTGLGLNLGGKHTLCGDYIYSGHTLVLVISALFIGQYSPLRWRIVHVFSWLMTLAGMFLLIMSRGHYTIDVIISYFVCTRLFYLYHTMAAMPSLRISPQNHHRKEIWWRLFEFMEGRIMRPLPRKYDNPFPLREFIALIRPGGRAAAAAAAEGGAAAPAAAAVAAAPAASASTPLLPAGRVVRGSAPHQAPPPEYGSCCRTRQWLRARARVRNVAAATAVELDSAHFSVDPAPSSSFHATLRPFYLVLVDEYLLRPLRCPPLLLQYSTPC
ncbi:sms-1 [Pristionchus pacificus]|nr:sms-1 [Pristionchus pacificus]